MKLLRLLRLAFLYFSVATVLAEAAALGVLWTKGGLTEKKLLDLLAIAYNVDLAAKWARLEAAARPVEEEGQASYDEVLAARAAVSLDLDLREIAAEKGLTDIRQLDYLLEQEKQRYNQLKTTFDQRLANVRQGAADTALQDVLRQLESISPKLAKDQILRILDDGNIAPDASMNFVVTIFKAMPLEKRKKILAEFKNPKEAERLHEILSRIRSGVPDVALIRQTRDELKQVNSQQ